MPGKHHKKNQKKKAKKKLAKVAKDVVREEVALTKLKGSGAYQPTRFARLKGGGGYFSDLGSKLGSAVGGIGDGAKSLFDIFSGSGDYRNVRHSSRMAEINGITPAMKALAASTRNVVINPGGTMMGGSSLTFGSGAPRVSHREYIGDILSSDVFQTTPYTIQPGLATVGSTLFPWLSTIAKGFQQYKMHGMVLEFVSTGTAFSTTGGLGSVSYSTLYDASAPPLASTLAVKNNDYTTAAAPDASFIHPIECASKESPVVVRYIRTNNSPDALTTDERLDDIGTFQVTVEGCPNANNGYKIGELWATYDIELLKPALPDVHEGTTYIGHYSSTSGAGGNYSYTESAANSLPCTVLGTSGSLTLTMPKGYNGNYMLTILGCEQNVASGDTYSGTMVLTGLGTDCTTLFLANNNGNNGGIGNIGLWYNQAPNVPAGGLQSFGMVLFFSTIAENNGPNDNVIEFVFPVHTGGNAKVDLTIVVAPLDNDVTPFTIGARKFKTRAEAKLALSRRLVASEDERNQTLQNELSKMHALQRTMEETLAMFQKSSSSTPYLQVRADTPPVSTIDELEQRKQSLRAVADVGGAVVSAVSEATSSTLPKPAPRFFPFK